MHLGVGRLLAEMLLKTGGSRLYLYVDETTAPVLDPGRGRTNTGLRQRRLAWGIPKIDDL